MCASCTHRNDDTAARSAITAIRAPFAVLGVAIADRHNVGMDVPRDDEDDRVGDAACWLAAVCTECGAFVADEVCANCGATRAERF